MRTAYVKTFKVSQTINAPLDFTYSWCTDFREDDPKMIGSKNRRVIIEKSKGRVVWVTDKGGVGKDAVRSIWLMPPNAWHLSTSGDGHEEGDYRLKRVSAKKTRLDMSFDVTYYDKKEIEDDAEWARETKEHWGAYARHLEADYRRSLSS
jgi:hypothetical protein